MELIQAVETVAIWLTYGTFFMGVPAVLDILQKKRAEPGHFVGFTIGLLICIAWYNVGLFAPNPLASAQVIGLAINGLCMLVACVYVDDKTLAVKHVASVLAVHFGLGVFASHVAPTRDWAESGVFSFAILLNSAIAIMPLMSINEVKKHKCTYPMGMDFRNSLLLLCLSLAWGLHGVLLGDPGSTLFNALMVASWGTCLYYNTLYPFQPPAGSKKKVPGPSLKRVATSIKDFGDKVSNFTLEDFGGFGEDKQD